MIKAHPDSKVEAPATGMRSRKEGGVDEPINVASNACLADKAYRHLQ